MSDENSHEDERLTPLGEDAAGSAEDCVPFEREQVRFFLDSAIRAWRENRAQVAADAEAEHTAACYIDAFQSVRMSLFGELLPLVEIDDASTGHVSGPSVKEG